MDNETREEVKTLLTKALVNLDWKEDDTATEYIKDAYNEMIDKTGIGQINKQWKIGQINKQWKMIEETCLAKIKRKYG